MNFSIIDLDPRLRGDDKKDSCAKIGQLENALEIFFFAPNPI